MLPKGSEIKFRPSSAWDQYSWQIMAIAVALLAQSLLITWLFFEYRRRRQAEIVARQRMAELAHMNRRDAAGEMSASIAHEINQPLAAIVTSGYAGLRWLTHKTPNIEEAVESLNRIVGEGHRARQVVDTVRAMFKKGAAERIPPTSMNSFARFSR